MAAKTANPTTEKRSDRLLNGTVSLAEAFGSSGPSLKPNRETATIPGVKIVGFESRNRRRYLPEALRSAIPMYEGATVYVDHSEPGKSSRSYRDRFGTICNVRMTESGLVGDLKYKTKHPLAESVLEDVENETKGIGLSPNHFGNGPIRDGIRIVESITRVDSVDIVDNPATNRSFRESENQDVELAEQVADLSTKVAELTTKNAALTEQVAGLTTENSGLKAEKTAAEHKAKVAGWLAEHKIPDAARTPEFVALCESTTGELAEKAIKSLAGKLNEGKPQSVNGGSGGRNLKEGTGGKKTKTDDDGEDRSSVDFLRRR